MHTLTLPGLRYMTEQEYVDMFLDYNFINQSIKLNWISNNRQLFAELVDVTGRGGRTALHLASMEGHTEIVKLLLDANASVDVKEYYGRTSLHLASTHKRTVIVKLLLEATLYAQA